MWLKKYNFSNMEANKSNDSRSCHKKKKKNVICWCSFRFPRDIFAVRAGYRIRGVLGGIPPYKKLNKVLPFSLLTSIILTYAFMIRCSVYNSSWSFQSNALVDRLVSCLINDNNDLLLCLYS